MHRRPDRHYRHPPHYGHSPFGYRTYVGGAPRDVIGGLTPALLLGALGGPIYAAVGLGAGAVLEFAGDVASSAAPDWLKERVAHAAEFVGDFAKTPYGFQVLAILSGAASVALAPITGPAIVNLTMSAPGLVAGEDFTTAWTKGTIDAIEKFVVVVGTLPAAGVAGLGVGVKGALAGGKLALAAIAGSSGGNIGLDELGKKILLQQAAGVAFADDIENTIKDPDFQRFTGDLAAAAKDAGVSPAKILADRGITIEKIAGDFGIRPDVAAIAFNAAVHAMIFDPQIFDPVTGSKWLYSSGLPLFWRGPSMGDESTYYRDRIADLERVDPNEAVGDTHLRVGETIAKLRDRLAIADQEKASPSTDAHAIKTRILIFQANGGDPSYIASLQARADAAATRDRIALASLLLLARQKRAAILAHDAAARGDFAIAPINDVPPQFRPPLSLGGTLREIAIAALLAAPAWGTWLYLRRSP